jgi:hypothetical protein
MKLGTENRKKMAFLAVLALLMVYLLYTNVFSGPGGAPDRGGPPEPQESTRAGSGGAAPGPEGTPPGSEGTPAPETPRTQAARAPGSNRNASTGRGEEFHPVLHSKRPEDRIDPMSIDPILRLDLLAKVQGVEQAGGSRNLFQYGPLPVKAETLKGPEPKVIPNPVVKAADDAAKPAAPPPPPPINLKYYGFSTARSNGKKMAFFLDGDEISVAGEGDTVKKRYRVVRIGVNSVVMEDSESKRQQSLPLTEEQTS